VSPLVKKIIKKKPKKLLLWSLIDYSNNQSKIVATKKSRNATIEERKREGEEKFTIFFFCLFHKKSRLVSLIDNINNYFCIR
jgi:hypothetical protein